GRRPPAQHQVGPQCQELRACKTRSIKFKETPSVLDREISTDGPSRLIHNVVKCLDPGLGVRVGLQERVHPTDTPHAIWLLRPRCKRPCGRRAAERRDELAPFHCRGPPVLPAKRIARLSYGRRLGSDDHLTAMRRRELGNAKSIPS